MRFVKLFGICILFVMIREVYASERPVNAEATYNLAEKYYYQKKFDIANALLERVIKASPSHPKALSLKADICFFKEDYRCAVNLYSKSIPVSEEPGKDSFRKAQSYIYLGQFDFALEEFTKAHELDSSLNFVYFQKGYIHLVFKRDKLQAIKYWEIFVREALDDPQRIKVEQALLLLRDKNFILPPVGTPFDLSDVMKEAAKPQATAVKPKDAQAPPEKARKSDEGIELLEDLDEVPGADGDGTVSEPGSEEQAESGTEKDGAPRAESESETKAEPEANQQTNIDPETKKEETKPESEGNKTH